MGRIISKLSDLDLFGMATPLPLNIKGKEKVHSCLGLLLTFITMTFLIVVAIVIFVNFLHRTSPSVVQSSLKGVLENEPFYINSQTNGNNSFNFGFAIFSRDDGVWLVDPSYYTVYAVYTKFNREDKTTSRTRMDVQLCPPGRFQKNSYCLSSVGPDGAPAQILSYTDITIDLVIQPCRKGGNVVCAPQEDINKKISSSLLYVFREDWSIDAMNFSNPIKPIDPTKTAFVIALTHLSYKSVKLYLNKIEVVTDVGWLFEKNIRQNVTTLEEYTLDYEERLSDQNPFAFIRLQTKCNKIVYNRKYLKIQDMLAQVDGLATFLLLVFCFVIMPYSRIKMQEALVNEAFKLGNQKAPSKSSITPIFQRDKIETKGKESQPDNRNTCPEKSGENKIDRNSEQSILKLFKSQSQSGRTILKERKTREECNRRTCPPSFPMMLKQGSDKKLLKSFVTYDTNENENFEVKITNLDLPCDEREVTDTRQYQPLSNTPSSGIERRSTQEIELMTNASDNTPQSQNLQTLQSLQEQDIVMSKESPEAVEIKIELEENQSFYEEIPIVASTPKIQVSFCQWVLSFFTRQSQIKTLEKASNRLFKSLDLITLSRSIAELELLKDVLFNKEQRVLFENLSTPSLFSDTNGNQNPISPQDGDCDGKIGWSKNELEEAYRVVRQCPNKTSVDSSLLLLCRKKHSKENA